MDTAQWPEGIVVVKPTMEGNSSGTVISNNKAKITGGGGGGSKPQIKPQAANCPRCNSSHIKFCYYNNYSLSQPRYFCKTCRRYWTEGGSLRNVPVGGGSRKNKRSSSSSSSLFSKTKNSTNISQNPNNKIIFHEGQDLNLAYPPLSTGVPEFVEFPSSTTSSSYHHRIPEILKSGSINGGIRGFSSFMSMINPASDLINTTPALVYSSSSTIATSGQLPNFQEFSKPSRLDFSLDHHGLIGSTLQGVNHHHHHQESSVISNSHEKLFFPFEDLKQQPPVLNSSSTPELMEMQSSRVTRDHQGDIHPPHESTGSYWNINGSGLGGHGGASW